MSPSVSVRLLSTQSDARLLALARQGHERAFEALVQRYRRPLLAYCRRVLLPDSRAEDALQQALLQAWLALQGGTEVRDAKAWLYRIVHNAALNTLRGSGYDYAELTEALSGAAAPQEDLDRRIAVREALAGLAALPELQREALLRTAVEGHSHEQVAEAMGLSEGALRGLVYRARATLRTAVTAITPAPLVSWAVGAGSHGGAIAELAVGGGSAGVGGLLLKGGAVALTAGVLVTGAGTVEHHRHAASRTASREHADGVRPVGASSQTDVQLVSRLVSGGVRQSASAPSGEGADRHGSHGTDGRPLLAEHESGGLPHSRDRSEQHGSGGGEDQHGPSSRHRDDGGDGGSGDGGRSVAPSGSGEGRGDGGGDSSGSGGRDSGSEGSGTSGHDGGTSGGDTTGGGDSGSGGGGGSTSSGGSSDGGGDATPSGSHSGDGSGSTGSDGGGDAGAPYGGSGG